MATTTSGLSFRGRRVLEVPEIGANSFYLAIDITAAKVLGGQRDSMKR